MDGDIKYDDNFLDDLIEKFTYERYLNKPETLYRIQSEYLQFRMDIWGQIQSKRMIMSMKVPLKDQNGKNFRYLIPPFLHEIIHNIDVVAKKQIDELVSKEIHKNLIKEKYNR